MKVRNIVKRRNVLVALMVGIFFVLVGCQTQTSEPLKIAALNGPTGMGLIQLIDQADAKYEITIYQSPDEITAKVISGEVDIACVPSNLGAVLYNKTKQVQLVGVNTLGVLYLVENGQSITSLEDVKGKTILSSGQGAVPQFVLEYLLEQQGINPKEDVTIQYLANHTDIASTLLTQEGTIALLPQPFVTTVLAKDDAVRVVMDMNALWTDTTGEGLPMGVVITQKQVAKNRAKEIEAFVKEYRDSVAFIEENLEEAANLIVKHELLPNVEIAKIAIPNCNIVFEEKEEARVMLDAFFRILEQNEPKSVGGIIPDEGFYQ
jgi:NitT/TauT family transport system substrate-binding protein